MKKLYFIPHGETVWTAEKKICGATDIELTDFGREEADALGMIFQYSRFGIQEILCSSLVRTKETADIMSKRMLVHVEVDDRLKEQNFGKYEGMPLDCKEFRAAKKCFNDSYEGGESMLRFASRVYPVLDEIKRDHMTYLIVGGSSLARMINSYFHDSTNKDFAVFEAKKHIILKYEFE